MQDRDLARKGKNRNAREIPFEVDGQTYLLDSQEEWCFFHWVKEMKDRGLLLEYVYQPRSWVLSDKVEYVPYLPVGPKKRPKKPRFLFHPHVYTADFQLRFDATNIPLMEYLSQTFKVREQDVEDGVLTLVVDVKGTFMSNDARSFPMNQKWMQLVHGICVQKFVPKVDFRKLGVPRRCATTMRSGKVSKVFKGMDFVETVLGRFGLA